jgi:hypothetical protein
MSLSAWDRLLLRENLFWAWQKAAALYRTTEVLHDQSEVASFDLDLEANLESIRRDFARGAYKLQSIKLLPQPKGPDGNKHRMRQSFQISVRDQVAWIAVVNAIGPGLDIQMPPWSYGHRLHRSAWLPDEWEKDQSTRIGPYRHSSSQLFRKFRQSWPLYRRHIVLTARHLGLGHIRVEDLDEGERRALETELSEFNTGRLPYLINGYFENVQIGGGTVYYASLDLEKFYPSISTSVIFEQFLKHSSDVSSDQRILNLIQRMLNFRVSAYGLSSEMQRCEPPASEGKYDRVPTGLMVAGFLSNVAMLDVDNQVTKELC